MHAICSHCLKSNERNIPRRREQSYRDRGRAVNITGILLKDSNVCVCVCVCVCVRVCVRACVHARERASERASERVSE